MATATQPTQQPTPASQLAVIQHKLGKWELTHLRALTASLVEQVEQLESNLERARADAEAAWREVEVWRDQLTNMVDDIQTTGCRVGLTQTGQLVTMPMPTSGGVDIDAVHQRINACVPKTIVDADALRRAGDNGYAVREGGAA